MKKDTLQPEPLFRELRSKLRNAMDHELQKLPETLQALEPKERIDMIIKLMPFVLPKCESIHPTAYENDYDSFFQGDYSN